MNTVICICLVISSSCLGNKYDFGMPNGHNTNVNGNGNGISRGNMNGLMPVFQTEELLQVQGYHEAEARPHGRGETEDISLQLLRTATDTSLQLPAIARDTSLPTMSDETEIGLFAWIASLDGDSEYRLVSDSNDGSNAGSGSGNSAGVEIQLPAECRLDGVQSTPWYASPYNFIMPVLITIFTFFVIGVNPNTESALESIFIQVNEWYLDMEVQSMSGFSLNYQILITNQSLLWRASLSISCIVGYIGCRNAQWYQFKVDNTTAKSLQGTLYGVFVVAVFTVFIFAVLSNLEDEKTLAASAILRLFLVGLSPLVVNAEMVHSTRMLTLYVVLPIHCIFQAGPVARANLLVQSEPISDGNLLKLSMQTLWGSMLVSPWIHLGSTIFAVSLTDHVMEHFWFMAWLVTFGSCKLIDSSHLLPIQASICGFTCVVVAAKIKIIQHYYAQPQTENVEFLKDCSNFRHLLTNLRMDTQVLHQRVGFFRWEVAKIRDGFPGNL